MSLSVSDLIVPFIAVIFLTQVIDKLIMFVDWLVKVSPTKYDHIERWFAYGLIFVVSFFLCRVAHFDFFGFLGFTFDHDFWKWAFTAGLISGGSRYIKESFSLIEGLPGIITGMVSYFSSSKTVATGEAAKEIAKNMPANVVESTEIASEPIESETKGGI